jgi:hypothetical protein
LNALTDEDLLALYRQVLRSINTATEQYNHIKRIGSLGDLKGFFRQSAVAAAERWKLHAVKLLSRCDLIETELLNRGER